MYLPNYGHFDHTVILNDQDPDLTPVEYALPTPPPVKDIANFDLPKAEQYWRPPAVKPKDIAKMNPGERQEFEEQELYRIDHGYWFFNNGVPTYITGPHYLYIAWWHIDIGLPEYRDRDKRWFYFWDYCQKDNVCLGMAYVKHRREGATYRAGLINYYTTTSAERYHGGIQSKTGDDAIKVFQLHIVQPWRRLPEFLRPIYSGTTDPKKRLDFSAPAERITAKNLHKSREIEALDSFIDCEVSNENAYDSQKLQFMHLDETGKMIEMDLKKCWKVIRECLMLAGRVIGKCLMTSTVDEMEKMGGAAYHQVWKDSNMKKRKPDGKTVSGLYPYFSPAWDGMENYVDRYGMGVVDAPTPEQLSYLKNKNPGFNYRPGIGSKLDWEQTRAYYKDNGLVEEYEEHCRLFPGSSKEAFRTATDKCLFNTAKLNERLDLFETAEEGGWVQGNLHWEPEFDVGGKVIKERDTRVKFVPEPNGRLWLRWVPSGEHANKVKRDPWGRLMPNNTESMSFGGDPIDHKVVKDQKPSKGALSGFRKWDMTLDPLGKPFDQWETNKFVVRYVERPAGGPKVYYEDVCKALFYFGGEILIEQQRTGLYNYLLERGYELFCANRPESTFGASKSSQKADEVGVHGSELLHERIFEYVDIYINDWWLLLDDPVLIEEWKTMDITDMKKFDLGIASGLSLLLSRKFVRPKIETPEGVSLVKVYKKRWK